jgi:hypothetical protein
MAGTTAGKLLKVFVISLFLLDVEFFVFKILFLFIYFDKNSPNFSFS